MIKCYIFSFLIPTTLISSCNSNDIQGQLNASHSFGIKMLLFNYALHFYTIHVNVRSRPHPLSQGLCCPHLRSHPKKSRCLDSDSTVRGQKGPTKACTLPLKSISSIPFHWSTYFDSLPIHYMNIYSLANSNCRQSPKRTQNVVCLCV